MQMFKMVDGVEVDMSPDEAEKFIAQQKLDAKTPVTQQISDRQFFQQLSVLGIITEEQALASNAAVIPPPLLAIIDKMPEDQQFAIKMLISGATTFYSDHPITIAISRAYGWSDEQRVDFFKTAALL
jgi:hypothetical protein